MSEKELPREFDGLIGQSAVPERISILLLAMLGNVDAAHAMIDQALGLRDVGAARVALRGAQIHTEIARACISADWNAVSAAMEDLRALAN